MALGHPLTDTMRKTTNRQFEVWRRWLAARWNSPDRTDHYLMQVAAEVRRGRVKNPASVSVDDLKLPFKVVAADPPPPSPESASARSKAGWSAALGGVTVTKNPPPPTPAGDK